ncbi:MAG: thiamine-phosphate kinase [Algisphaera sp.]
MQENDLLQHVYAANAALPENVTLPPGDDMGAIAFGGDTLLVTVDQLIAGVHFDPATATPEQIGRKAVTRNVSDVAAMAAQPVAGVAAVALPPSYGTRDTQRLFDAVRETAAQYGCPLIGGDIAVSEGPLSITVTLWARPDGIEPVIRHGSQPGDAIYVSGALGHSIHGHHLRFEPRLILARALAGHAATRPRAMMDLSDGLAQDLPRLTPHAEIQASSLPLREGPADAQLPWRHAVGDGEDYELLFTAAPDTPIPNELAGVPLTRIGTVMDSGGVVVIAQGQRHPVAGLGWEHCGGVS